MLKLCWIAATLALTTIGPARGASPDRPNLVVFIADDQRWDCLGSAGHPLLRTPNIDRIAAKGVSFDHAFVTTAICAVSRASFYTGRLARNHGVGDFATPLPPEVLAESLPARLRAGGYRTACLGKWGIGGPEPRDLFDTWFAWGGQGEFFHEVDGEEVHNEELLARKAVEFLSDRADDRPFFLLVLYKGPHDPFLPDRRDEDLFADDLVPVPPTYSDAHFEAMPAFIRESEGRTRLLRRHPDPEAFQEFAKQYLRCIASIDRSVGQVLDALDAEGLAGETAVVYTSDHGFFLGEHGLSGKWLMHEESIRIPMLVRAPGVVPGEQEGSRVEPMALNIDLAPTLLDLAGVPIPGGIDGRSLAPVLRGEPPEDWRDSFFYEHHFHYEGRIPRSEGVRTADRKYITYPDADPTFEELYDLRSDPMEQRNLAADPVRRDDLEAMRARYRAFVEALPPPVLPAEGPPPTGALPGLGGAER